MTSDPQTLVIRPAGAEDARALERLAQLDCGPRMTGEVLVAEVDGCLRAAQRLRDGAVVADPFSPTLDLVALLEAHRRLLADRVASRNPRPAVHGPSLAAPAGRTYQLSCR